MTTTLTAEQQPGPFDAVMDITPRPPLVFVAGHGSWLTDTEGRRYLDFIQGWAVNTLGHSPRPILDALTRQAERLINCSPAFYNDQMKLAVEPGAFEAWVAPDSAAGVRVSFQLAPGN